MGSKTKVLLNKQFTIFNEFNIICQQYPKEYSNIFMITPLRVLGTISISYDLVVGNTLKLRKSENITDKTN